MEQTPLPLAEAPAGNPLARMKTEILSGLTVALALVPEAVAFAFVAGVNPLVGLYAAFVVGIVTALFGGRPGMISGATGALAVVMVTLVAQHGEQYLFPTVILMGVLQVLAGTFHLGKFIRLVPYPVMMGFVNGLAIVIFVAQKGQFQLEGEWLQGADMWLMLGLTGLTMLIIWGMPKFTKAFPAPLAGIVVVSALVIGMGLDTRTVGDMVPEGIAGGLPSLIIPDVPFNWDTMAIIFPYALILATIGLIESLLTLNLVAEITETKGGASKECIALGGANVLSGFTGGMGGCAMIGQSMINISSGGRTRWSSGSSAIFLLIFILFTSSLIEMIPLAALTGVMFMVVIGTFAWSSFRIIFKIPKTDAFVLVLVSAVTYFYDLAIAVIVGVIVSALAYAWKVSTHIHARKRMTGENQKTYFLEGPLFFASVESFNELFDPRNDPEDVVIDFIDSRVVDHSALQAIDAIAERYKRNGKTLHLKHLSPDCHARLTKARNLVEVSMDEDPHYGLVVDYDEEVGEAKA